MNTKHDQHTPRKTNMSPDNQWLEDVFPIEIVPFLGDMLVFGGVRFRNPKANHLTCMKPCKQSDIYHIN